MYSTFRRSTGLLPDTLPPARCVDPSQDYLARVAHNNRALKRDILIGAAVLTITDVVLNTLFEQGGCLTFCDSLSCYDVCPKEMLAPGLLRHIVGLSLCVVGGLSATFRYRYFIWTQQELIKEYLVAQPPQLV